MLEECVGGGTIGDDAKPFLAGVTLAPEGLRDLRGWIEGVVHLTGADRLLSAELLQQGILADVRWLLTKVPYRGQELGVHQFERWLVQFPMELRSLATHVLQQIAQRYYIGVRQFHDALSILITQSGIPAGSAVTFCRWQGMGRSAPRVMHAIRNQARWKSQGSDIDLEDRPDRWPKSGSESRWFVLADDFVGSGKTLSALASGPGAPLPELLARYPGSGVRVLIVAGFERGLRRIAGELARYGTRVRLVPCYLFSEADRCFSSESSIFPNVKHRESFREFCQRAAEVHFPTLPSEWRLGFRGVGAVVIFYDSVPNNSLPILWHDRGTWFPLFPASGMREA
jgi:hypothetical protein